MAASPGDVIPVAAGNHPSQSISCQKAAPGVTFQAVGRVVVGNTGASENCLSVSGTYITVAGAETSYYGTNRQCGVAVGRGSHHVTLRDVDAGHFWIAGDDASHHRWRLRTDTRQGVEVQRADLLGDELHLHAQSGRWSTARTSTTTGGARSTWSASRSTAEPTQ